MTDLTKILQQAEAMQAKMEKAQTKINEIEAEGIAGAGLVAVTLKGKGDMVSVRIDPALMDEKAEFVEDLVRAAHNEARKNLDEAAGKAMKEAACGLEGVIPGFKMPV